MRIHALIGAGKFLTFVLLSFAPGCSDGRIGPNPFLPSGQVRITTAYINNKPSGFSFSKGSVITIPNEAKIIPEIVIIVHIDQNDSIAGVFFAGPSEQTFKLAYQTTSLDSARAYFYTLREVPVSDTDYSFLALPVIAHQVWIVKTSDKKYGKILVVHSAAHRDRLRDHGEATFEWVFQPDGSNQF